MFYGKSRQYISEDTSELFIQVHSSTTAFSVNDLLDNFSSKITKVINDIALTKVKGVSDKKKAQ